MVKPKNETEDGSGTLFKNSMFDPQVTKRYVKLRKRKKRPEFDFTVKVKGKKIAVHKEILLKRCKLFETMLQHNCTETSSNSVSVSFNEDIKIWSEILDYLYTGEITITFENMFYIYSTSKYLMLDELKTFCNRFIKRSINHETVETIRDVAQQYLLTEIVEYTTNFLEMNFEDFTSHNEMVEWSSELVQELVKSDKLQVRSEAKVVELIVNWLNHQFDSRKVDMDKLLNEVRFSFLTHDKIADAINDDVYLSILQRFTNGMASHLKNPTHRVYCPRLYYKGIYIYGSGDIRSDFVFCRYLPNDKSLVTLNSSFDKRTMGCTTILNGKVYLIGGLTFVGPDRVTNKVEVYDPVADTWSVGPPLNIPRFRFGSCTFEGKIYVFGGYERLNSSDKALNTVKRIEYLRSEVYCPDEDRWEFVPGDGPQELQLEVKAVAFGDGIFVVQHRKYGENGNLAYVIQQFKPGTNEWIDIPHDECLETRGLRNNHLVVGHGSKLFLIQSIYKYIVYDTEIKTFHKISFYPQLGGYSFDIGCIDTAVTTFRDFIYLFGRSSYKTCEIDVAKFDPKEKPIPSRHTLQTTTSFQGPVFRRGKYVCS